jgi:hypothetical protein
VIFLSWIKYLPIPTALALVTGLYINVMTSMDEYKIKSLCMKYNRILESRDNTSIKKHKQIVFNYLIYHLADQGHYPQDHSYWCEKLKTENEKLMTESIKE